VAAKFVSAFEEWEGVRKPRDEAVADVKKIRAELDRVADGLKKGCVIAND
jgi:hypothetical protein